MSKIYHSPEDSLLATGIDTTTIEGIEVDKDGNEGRGIGGETGVPSKEAVVVLLNLRSYVLMWLRSRPNSWI